MRWSVEPGLGYATWPTRLGRRYGIPIASAGSDAIGICSWDAGEPELQAGSVVGRFDAIEGSEALVVLAAGDLGGAGAREKGG